MDFDGFPVREVLLGAVALAVVYLAVMMLRLSQVGKRKTLPAEPSLPARTAPAAVPDEDPDEDPDGEEQVFTYAMPAPAAANDTRSFDAELERSQLEREIKQLRDELAELRTELDDMKAAHRVSPQYADAMALVQRGLTAQDVADRCGISIGEAELVWALARGPRQFEEEDDHGIDSGNTRARSA